MVPAFDLCLHPHGVFSRWPFAIRHPGFHGNADSAVDLRHRGCSSSRASPPRAAASSASSPSEEPTRYAVLGAGFAGLSVAWHLLEKSPKESPLCVDVYDEIGIGGGASGVAGGLIHPYSPKGKLLWRGAEFWRECLKLLSIAERAPTVRARDGVSADLLDSPNEQIVWRRGIVRPATTLKNAEILKENAQGCLDSCSIKILDQYAVQKLVPGLCAPFNSAIYMPQAVNVHPRRYLQALFLACKNLADDFSASGSEREVTLYKKSLGSLQKLSGSYNGVIICLGAKADMLPELSGIVPLRMCRGVVAHMKLPDDIREPYGSWSPSVLSDAWLAVQGPRTAIMGSTWQWGSRDYSSRVSPEEGCRAFEELLPKASVVYPAVKQWEFVGASGGLRAMPPLTALGSLPLLGCVNDLVGEKFGCNYWLIGGLGARGLLYHGLLGKLTAQAVISSNEGILPSELTSWKKLKFAKGKMTGHLGEKERIKVASSPNLVIEHGQFERGVSSYILKALKMQLHATKCS